jgi:stage II sporulation protein D
MLGGFMKKLLYKTLIVSVVVLVIPFLLTLIFSQHNKADSIETMDFTIYYEINGSKEELSFDEYLLGVVAANMPAGYQMEALKAQAVIARTYALYNISLLTKENPSQNSFTTSELGLSYIGLDALEQFWGSENYHSYFTRFENAVYATRGEILVYRDDLILPVFFNTGSGFTRNASEAWGIDIPYLVSVPSKQDVTSTNYLKIEEYITTELIALLDRYYDNLDLSEENFFDKVIVASRDSAGYVLKIDLDGLTVSGEEFAKVLGLSSNHFYIEEYEGNARIICNGSGHGVGLSQYGANSMAEEGNSYIEILEYYYTGVNLDNLSEGD